MRGSIAIAISAVVFAGCASMDPYASEPIARHLERDDAVGYCARLFADIDRRVETLDVRDSEAPRIVGFPYLRTDRLASALAPHAIDGEPRRAWMARLFELDDRGRSVELPNAALPADDIARCRVLLAAEDEGRYGELQARAQVADDYSLLLRSVGLYPLTRYAFAAGVAHWQRSTRATFAVPLEQLPVRGTLRRYGAAGETAAVALPVPVDALGMPVLSRFDRMALLQRHAPLLEIDVAGEHDRPGALVLDSGDRPVVEPSVPVAYARVAHALLDGRPHLQLVYTFWFGGRPARHWLDPLAGRIDGLVWRVTLGRDGTPLVYDSIHPCGCYHLFFPTEHVTPRERRGSLDEGMFAPQAVRAPSPGEAVVVRIESGTHYIQRVRTEKRVGEPLRYRLDDERRLGMLPRRGGGTRSAYGSDGLMAGTERGERFFFWPTGIASAGQMRQWGHHATAFVGRRHFDDPLLVDSYFVLRPAGSARPAP